MVLNVINFPIIQLDQLSHHPTWLTFPSPNLINFSTPQLDQLYHHPTWSTLPSPNLINLPSPKLINFPISQLNQLAHHPTWSTCPSANLINFPNSISLQIARTVFHFSAFKLGDNVISVISCFINRTLDNFLTRASDWPISYSSDQSYLHNIK